MTPPFHPPSVTDALKCINALFGWHQHPRNGKIARLPEPMRNWINQMLDDGLTYRAIVRALQFCPTPPPYPISEMNLSNWYRGGYQDWRQQRLLNEARLPAAVGQPARTNRLPFGAIRSYSELLGAIRGY